MTTPTKPLTKPFHEILGIASSTATNNAQGNPILVDVLSDAEIAAIADFLPEEDKDYVFPLIETKYLMAGIKMNKPVLIHGPHGTGKTTLLEQFCHRTNRPVIRVQHTVNTEEAHINGHYVIKPRVVSSKGSPDQVVNETVFEPGPLPLAMRLGQVYLADEYDFALPSVTSVYQPVLEGKALVIKEAPPEWRVVKPHPNFRFVATGNTNGSGDETGLYQGTQIMNAANYSRFGITIKMDYLPEKLEVPIIVAKAKIHSDDAIKLCKIAGEIRKAFQDGKLSATISPRELINAGLLGRMFGKKPNLHLGMQLAYGNRLNSADAKGVMEYIQRHAPPEPAVAA